ncbi:GNAT family N-acetyltransferase [Brevibacterium renqingii]|uniref:GNAT family N-acetyltransferase n=1 Tax=Brevibacterium renqingii TaxID=2776916 RepID=UPI001AE06D89|nr:GNAT family N-acetyltransferase [Brevibacterium renqingii]
MEITHIRAGALADPAVDVLLDEIVDFDRRINRALGYGEDFDPLPGSVRSKLVRTDEFTSHEIWLGRVDGRLVAKAGAYLSLQDNTDVADVYAGVLPERRRSGLGTELLTVMERHLGDAGRTRLNAWCEVPAADFDADPRRPRIAAAAGTGSLPAERAEVAFALRRGYGLQQLERCSVANIQDSTSGAQGSSPGSVGSSPGNRATRLGETERSAAGVGDRVGADDGYVIRTWAGPAPHEHVQSIALLRQRMSTDVPGAADLQDEEIWNPARVRALEADREQAGGRTQTALALHDGEGVGFTEVVSYAQRPHVAFQGATLVVREHRGHGLGARLKSSNHAALLEGSEVERVYTWNAAENSWMLAINERAGFEVVGWVGLWKKILA